MNKKPTTSKKELLRRTNKYFKKDENSWLELDKFIEEECPKGYRENKGWIIGVANYLQNTAKYNYEIQDGTGLYIIKPNPSYRWDKQNLLGNRIKIILITAIITALFSLLVGWLIFRLNNQRQVQIDQKQDKTMDNLNDEVNRLSNDLRTVQDVLAKPKNTVALINSPVDQKHKPKTQ